MGKVITYQKGQMLGDHGITFVSDIPTKVNELRRAKFKCHCGKEFENTMIAIKRTHTKSCGCLANPNSYYKHGQFIGDNGIQFLEYVSYKIGKDRAGKFKCYCGKEFIATITSVVINKRKSCGCLVGWNFRVLKEYKAGQKIGSYGFTFIKEVEDRVGKERMALVKCHCGKEYKSIITKIVNDYIKSCGCNRGKDKWIEYKEGQILGSYGIKFIKDAGKNKYGQRTAIFKCWCGSEFIAAVNTIKCNAQKACGNHCAWNRIKYKEGQVLGNYGIKFIKNSGSNSCNQRKAFFKCWCGKEFIATIEHVKSNTTTTCGCSSKSLGEDKITDILKSKNINFYPEYREEECRDKVALPFDFAIKNDSQILSFIEYDGPHHFEPIAFFGGEKHFLYTKKHDQIKNEYCGENNIPLLRIPYTEFNNLESIVSDFLATINVQ